MTTLRAGPVTALYEEGGLRYVRWGDREILRRIYGAVRDRNWDTLVPALSRVRVEQGAESFLVTFLADGGDFAWDGTIRGTVNGTITFSFEGQARRAFLRNRIGLCVLHPIRECAGRPCFVEHADGSVTRGAFPACISPHQPFKSMRSISHEVAPGVEATVRFEGDVFEMEDQRNWTDASFKTYSTPLELPFPVEIVPGARIRQAVTLRVAGAPPPPVAEAPITVSAGTDARPLPRLGAAGAGLDADLAPLRPLGLAHLRADLRGDFLPLLRRAAAQASELGAELELALHDGEPAELRRALDEIRPRVAALLVFGDRSRLAEARRAFPGVPIAGGTDAYFAELNRNRPPLELIDAVAWSVNPQVHSFDDATLVENLEAQGFTVESARAFFPGKALRVGPVTLRPRFNPNATAAGAAPEPDPRGATPFGAAWTLVSLKYLAESGADAVTYHDLRTPALSALAEAAPFAGGEILLSRSTRPLAVDGLVLRKGGRTRTLLVNLTDTPQRANGLDLAPHEIRRIDG